MMLSSWLKLALRLTVVALAIKSTIAAVPGSHNVSAQDGDFLRQLPEVLDLLCPYDKTCRGGKPRLQLNKGTKSCCTECSCEDSCGLTESCCYPEQAAHNYFNRRHQQCELPSTMSVERMREEKRFYMVTSGYRNGSEENCGTGNVTCGENEAASALGSLYPVSSKTTTVIYKNEQCARCHGVAKSDIIPWQAKMTCLLDRDRVDTLLQSLETGRVHNSCLLDFFYPGPEADINVHQCYEHTRRSCRHEEGLSYYLPSYLNMTDDEVRNACLNGPQAQYKGNYNLFCFLCRYNVYRVENQCAGTDFGDRSSLPGTFSALLRPKYLQNRAFGKEADTETKAQIQPVPIACQGGLQIDADDCRPALCPSGQVRLGAARQCVYPDRTMFLPNFKLAVELYPGDNMAVSSILGPLNTYLQQGKDWRAFISAPGVNSWRLSAICYHDDTYKTTNNGSAGFIWLKLTLEETKPSSLAKLLANVDNIMTGYWHFVVNTTSVPLEQRFSEFEELEYNRTTNTFKQLYADDLDPELICTVFDRPQRSISIHVTKTFFCDQVALKPIEYVIDKRSEKLYVNATGRAFSPAEFSLGYDANGDPEPRLCLEDTDYVLVPQTNPASHNGVQTLNHSSIIALVVISQLI